MSLVPNRSVVPLPQYQNDRDNNQDNDQGNNRSPINRIPLQVVLIVPFVLQIFAAVGLVGYLSFRNGQRSVNELATQVRSQVSNRAKSYLDRYLEKPQILNDINARAFRGGQMKLEDTSTIVRTFSQQAQIFRDIRYVYLRWREKRACLRIH